MGLIAFVTLHIIYVPLYILFYLETIAWSNDKVCLLYTCKTQSDDKFCLEANENVRFGSDFRIPPGLLLRVSLKVRDTSEPGSLKAYFVPDKFNFAPLSMH